MIVLHLSDLHLSRYGEGGVLEMRRRDDARGWVSLHRWQGWDVEGCRDRKKRPDRLRLVDPAGVIHKERGWPGRKEDKAITGLLTLAMERHRLSAEKLIHARPDRQDLEALMRVDPRNTNLRFLKLVDRVNFIGPDALLVTGDLTDHGFGYDLVKHYFEPWVRARRLFCVPGNHDTYDMFPGSGRRKRAELKENNYHRFAEEIGMSPNDAGTYLRHLGDVAVVGIDSCDMPRTPLSASGSVSSDQIRWLHELADDPAFSGARLRIGLIHHHMLRIPFRPGRRSPLDVGIRLRNAADTVEAVSEAGFSMMFNGHRHHGYVVALPGRPLVVSSPSSTIGCRSGQRQAYCWLIDLEKDQPFAEMCKLPYDGSTSWKDGI